MFKKECRVAMIVGSIPVPGSKLFIFPLIGLNVWNLNEKKRRNCVNIRFCTVYFVIQNKT